MDFMRKTLACAAIVAVSSGVMAGDGDMDASRAHIAAMFPGVSEENIHPSPIPGILEVQVGAKVAYVSADARYLIQGSIYDLETDENLTETRRSLARVAAVDALGEDQMVIFSPDHPQHTVTVFTDVECGYCRKLHSQIDAYNDLGIRIRYVFFPRGGPGTSGWKKAEQVWCAPDRKEALTDAKKDKPFQTSDCGTTPVAKEYALGREFGIRGTPAILTEQGDLIGGYLSPHELLDYLVKSDHAASAQTDSESPATPAAKPN